MLKLQSNATPNSELYILQFEMYVCARPCYLEINNNCQDICSFGMVYAIELLARIASAGHTVLVSCYYTIRTYKRASTYTTNLNAIKIRVNYFLSDNASVL